MQPDPWYFSPQLLGPQLVIPARLHTSSPVSGSWSTTDSGPPESPCTACSIISFPLVLCTDRAGVLAALPVAGADPDILAQLLLHRRQLEQRVALGVGQDRNINLSVTRYFPQVLFNRVHLVEERRSRPVK